MSPPECGSIGHRDFIDCSALVERSRCAQQAVSRWSADQIDDLVAGVAWPLYYESTARMLNAKAVAESGVGNPFEMAVRQRGRIECTLNDMAGAITSGRVAHDPERGLTRYAKPVGVIATVTPRTAPIAAVAVHALSVLKTRNAVVFCPNPAVIGSVKMTVDLIRRTLAELGAPADLIQMVPAPSRESLSGLIRLTDLVVASGGERTVRAALSLGTPGYAGGVGNPPIIVDASADVEFAAAEIVMGKSADNGTSCSAESFVLVHREQAQAFKEALIDREAHILDRAQSAALLKWMWPNGRLNPDAIGRPAWSIARQIGCELEESIRCLVVESSPEDAFAVTREKLSPVLGLVQFDILQQAIDFARAALLIEGVGHSAGIYTQSSAAIALVSECLPVSRVMVNQSTGMGNTGRKSNGILPSVVLSCGSWGGMNTNENVTWRNYLNYTTVSHSIALETVDVPALFGRHWDPEDSAARALCMYDALSASNL